MHKTPISLSVLSANDSEAFLSPLSLLGCLH